MKYDIENEFNTIGVFREMIQKLSWVKDTKIVNTRKS